MRILVVAPFPFFQERGTPLATRLLVRTLADQGHAVDVLTLHEGEDPPDLGARVFRIPAPPFVRDVPIGFSWKKLVCDVFLAAALLRRAARERYDVVHAIEEAVYLARAARALLAVPYVYDMDSSLAAQLVESRPSFAPLAGFFRFMERCAMRGARAIVPMCEDLAEHARREAPGVPVHVIEDVPQGAASAPAPPLRDGSGPLLLYVGNLEPYQGVELLLDAMPRVLAREPGARLAIVGGRPDAVAALSARAPAGVRFLGARPVDELPGLLAQADILVSPRLLGNNTPMKLYSYMAAGVPIAATNIRAHTQVLDDSLAALAEPSPEPLADAILSLLADPAGARAKAARAKAVAEERYSIEAYRRKVAALYA